MKGDKWDISLGLIKVDGLKSTPEFQSLIEREKRGEITVSDIRETLNKTDRAKANAWYLCLWRYKRINQ